METLKEIRSLLDSYSIWMKDNTSLREINGSWVEITTPYLDRHNDALQIYARKDSDGILLTDDSYILHDLDISGCKLDSKKRQDLLKMTLNGFGVKLNESALEVHASPETFPSRKHDLVQAMLAVNDLFYLAQPMIASLFYEDVVSWLDENDVRFTPNVKFTGTSGFENHFDFVIPKFKAQPERIVQAITSPDKNKAQAFIHMWTDTRDVRSSESRAYAVLNDQDEPVSSEILEAFRNYAIRPVRWSHRSEILPELAA